MSWEHERDNSVRRAAGARKRRRHRRRIHRIKQLAFCTAMICMVCIGIVAMISIKRINIERVKEMEQEVQQNATETQIQKISSISQEEKEEETEKEEVEREEIEELLVGDWKGSGDYLEELEDCPKELQELLEKYPETYDYVMGYSQRDKYKGKSIDLTEDVAEGEVPLLIQWDKRWGYDNYGDKLIGAAGCGPTCMSMAYIYLTGNTEMNPRKMAEFADRNGYNSEAGTKWDFFTEGATILGLEGNEMSVTEDGMKAALDYGNVIICSMKPGDFTKGGHFIVIRGYDKNGFWVNDPNSRINSEKQWEYDTLRYQIKGAWSIGE